MKSGNAKDLISFVSEVEALRQKSKSYIFRGQPLKGNLLPTIARTDPAQNTRLKEKKVIEQLALMGASFLSNRDISKLDLLVLAQHQGLKTRLLDWTSNPLAALWFACASIESGDAYVYALDASELMLSDVYTQDPLSPRKTRVFQPRLNNARIIAQHGWFTLHNYSRKSGRFVPLEKNKDIKENITEIKIDKEFRGEMIKALDIIGISYRTLFPDISGLCLYLNWKFDQ